VREDGRIVGGEGWQEKVYNREEWKKLLRTARNRRILLMPMSELMKVKNDCTWKDQNVSTVPLYHANCISCYRKWYVLGAWYSAAVGNEM
jgi:hypothetical protein